MKRDRTHRGQTAPAQQHREAERGPALQTAGRSTLPCQRCLGPRTQRSVLVLLCLGFRHQRLKVRDGPRLGDNMDADRDCGVIARPHIEDKERLSARDGSIAVLSGEEAHGDASLD
eukprot:2730745-Rhodomonas_salina.1